MLHFAVLSNNIVTNVIVANTLEDAELATNSVCVEIQENKNAGIGDTWDGTKFIKPEPTE